MDASMGALVGTALLLSASLAYIYRKQQSTNQPQHVQRAEDELHPLLIDHSYFRPYTTKYATYPNIRTFYRPHSHKDKHSDIDELPLLVFVHGLGGVLPQFVGLLSSLTNIAPCFGLELPGHGRSTFSPKAYGAYTIEANVALWKTAIEDVCDQHGHKKVVLVGHSMGCSLAALLASTLSPVPTLSIPVAGIISICPRARQFTPKELKVARRLFNLPDFIINILRWLDRRGGEDSTSVKRVVGDSNESDLKRLQLSWNRQFRTPVLRRTTLGLLPQTVPDGTLVGGYPSEAVWRGIEAPLFLIAGESDRVCKPEEVDIIVQYITGKSIREAEKVKPPEDELQSSTNGLVPITIKAPKSIIQVVTFPAPAAHALFYAHTTYRLVSALIESFLSKYISDKIDFAYQLRLLTTSGKWDVKNLQKWKAVLPVSGPICTTESGNGLFRALKTMREQDDEHNPTQFLEKWAGKIYAVIDISHDAPVYDAKILGRGGVEYHKFPTVSKIPPTPVEVHDFCSLVDKLLAERDAKETAGEKRAIAVHCHYGYNRTGFFICSYLILRKGYGVQEAIDEFAKAKPPGIKHAHFLDTMWLRYARGSRGGMKPASDRGKKRWWVDSALVVPAHDDVGYGTEGDLM